MPLGVGQHVDIVMQAPRRFSQAVETAFIRAAAALTPLRVAPRLYCDEQINAEAVAARMIRLAGSGATGVILKAPQNPAIVEAVNTLMARGIPVVTWATDLANSRRAAYIGPDNYQAGRTAAFMLGRFLGNQPATVLTHVGSDLFIGEDERSRGFRALMVSDFPYLRVHDIVGGAGLDRPVRDLTRRALAECPNAVGVYSMGGGNCGILEAFEEVSRKPQAFVGHDLDANNRALLRAGRIDAVVEHDLLADAGSALSFLLRYKRVGHCEPPAASRAVIITPWNL